MPWTLIKNNFKLMLRDKRAIVILVVCPLIVITLLTSAFRDLLATYEGGGIFHVGYQIKDTSLSSDCMSLIKQEGEKHGIVLMEYPFGISEQRIKSGEYDVFIEQTGSSYRIYYSKEKEAQAIKLQYFIYEITQQCIKAGIQGSWQESGATMIEKPAIPKAEAKDYYGIIYIIYFIWVGIVAMYSIYFSEKSHHISKKYQMSPMSHLKRYLGKVIPCVAMIAAITLVYGSLATAIFDIHWGRTGMTLLILFLCILASSLLGIMVMELFSNIEVAIGVTFGLVFMAGFVGGSFETYMYSTTKDWIKELSVLYYINRTLVEYSTQGKSLYEGRCILYLIAIIVVCFVCGYLVTIRRKGE